VTALASPHENHETMRGRLGWIGEMAFISALGEKPAVTLKWVLIDVVSALWLVIARMIFVAPIFGGFCYIHIPDTSL
jgi:hypothetical protein